MKLDRLTQKELVVSIVALAVALLSAFSTFFRWDQSWRTNMQAKLALENLIASWKLDLLEAQGQASADRQVEAAIADMKKAGIMTSPIDGAAVRALIERAAKAPEAVRTRFGKLLAEK
jgi:hypothetical protein